MGLAAGLACVIHLNFINLQHWIEKVAECVLGSNIYKSPLYPRGILCLKRKISSERSEEMKFLW